MISILNKSNTLIVVAILVLAMLGSVPLFAHAQGSLSLSVTPTLFEMSANPGQLWKSSIKVINSNPFDLTVYASVVNFEPQGETGQGKLLPIFEVMTDGTTLAEWIEIDTEPITIKQEQSFQIPFYVEVPEDASPGGHFAAILISTQPPESVDDSLYVRTAQIVTSLFFVRVAGDVNESGTIRTFTTVDLFHQVPQTTFELRFENKGNVHLRPRGDIRIYNMWGKERGVIPINHRTHFGNVLPESIRKFNFTWEGEQSITDIGRYKAIATLAFGLGEKKYVTSTTHFWVVPLKSLFITLGTLFIFVLLATWGIKLYVRRMLQMAGITPSFRQERVRDAHTTQDTRGDVRIASYKNISAPVRFGYLDLRTRLQDVHAFSDVLKTLYSFIRSYKLFFVGIVIAGVGLYGLYYYISDVTVPDKEFNVTITNPDTNLDLSSEEIAYAEIVTQEGLRSLGDIQKQNYLLTIINTSGVSGTGASEAAALAREGYGISELELGEGRVDKRTIVVFDLSLQDEALALSKRLNGALLSARTASSSAQMPNITIFVGADRVDK